MLKGAKEFIAKLERLKSQAQFEAGKAMYPEVLKLDADTKKAISQGARSGKLYKRGNKTHQASAQGEYPKTDRGELVASLFIEDGDLRKGKLIYGASAPHAKPLEYKPPSQGGRPWLKPQFDKWKGDIGKAAKKAIIKFMAKEFRK